MDKKFVFGVFAMLALFSSFASAECRSVKYIGGGDANIALNAHAGGAESAAEFKFRIDANPYSPSACKFDAALEFDRPEGLEYALDKPEFELLQPMVYREYTLVVRARPLKSASGTYSGNIVFKDLNFPKWSVKFPVTVAVSGAGQTQAPAQEPAATPVPTPAPTQAPAATPAPSAAPVLEELPEATYAPLPAKQGGAGVKTGFAIVDENQSIALGATVAIVAIAALAFLKMRKKRE